MSEPQEIRVPVPKVTKEQAKSFGQVWNKNNPVILLLDDKTLQFAVDFAQIVLKSYVMDQVTKLVQQKQAQTIEGQLAKPLDAVSKIAAQPSMPQKSLVSLT
jgi:hypothetical protein